MATRRMQLGEWFAEIMGEGLDSLGAYELSLGAGVLVGYLVMWWSRARPGWGLGLLWLLCVTAVWLGARLEETQFRALGRRRFRGTLYRRITWVVALCAFVLAWLLVALAHARAWSSLEGWRDGPVLMMVTLGLYHLATGLNTRTARWIWLGAGLCALAVILPGVPVLREKLYLVTALLAGGSLLTAGLVGRLHFERQLRRPAPGMPPSAR